MKWFQFSIRAFLIVLVLAACLASYMGRPDKLEAAKSWQPIWVHEKTDIHEVLRPLLEMGFTLRSDATPGSPEASVWSVTGPLEIAEIVLVGVDGDRFVAFTAAVVDFEGQYELGAKIEVPVFGGLYYKSGELKESNLTGAQPSG